MATTHTPMPMASLSFTASPFLSTPPLPNPTTHLFKPSHSQSLSHQLRSPTPLTLSVVARSFKVVIEHDGESTELDVEEDETILERALESGVSVPHDCKLGVCMTCPARLITGSVDQSDGMLSDDVVERGYALLCASYPRSDCRIKLIPEDELLALQLATAND